MMPRTMPDMLAHYEVAEAARARLPEGPLARLLGAEHDAFKVGAQGPDFFFYAGVWPGQRSRADLAGLVHQHETSEVFHSMLTAATSATAAEASVITAYTCGYAAHLCLDASAHPWIQYWTGDITGNAAPVEPAARRRHGVLEGSLDVTLARRHSRDTGWIRAQRLLVMTPVQLTVVTGLWERVMRDVHGVTFSAAAGRRGFRDMVFAYGAMSDPRSAFSRALARVAATPFADADGTIRTQIYPREPHPVAAGLLAGRRTWYYPAVPGEQRTETFAEIAEAAAAQTLGCLEAIQTALFDGGDVDAAVAAIGDRNMLTGLPCEDPRPPVAFAPGLEQAWGLG
jgi:hypothetical protein